MLLLLPATASYGLFPVIPAKAGIQGGRDPAVALDPRLRGGDDSRISLGQRRQAFLDPLGRRAGQAGEFGARLGFRLGDASDHFGHLAVLGLAGEFKADPVGIVKIDAEQTGQLRDRPDIIDAARLEAGFNLAEARSGHREGTMLHRADRVAVTRRLLTFGDLEKGEEAVIAHIEEIMADPFIRRIASIARTGAES